MEEPKLECMRVDYNMRKIYKLIMEMRNDNIIDTNKEIFEIYDECEQ